MANPNIWNEAKKAGTTFKPWKSWNLNWRPKKWIALVNTELKEKWYEPATKQDIEVNYMSMLQLSQEELVNMWNDKTKPMLIRILAKNMLWWKWFDIIEKMLDRWIWKATQKIEQELKWDLHINPLEDKLKELWLSWQKNK